MFFIDILFILKNKTKMNNLYPKLTILLLWLKLLSADNVLFDLKKENSTMVLSHNRDASVIEIVYLHRMDSYLDAAFLQDNHFSSEIDIYPISATCFQDNETLWLNKDCTEALLISYCTRQFFGNEFLYNYLRCLTEMDTFPYHRLEAFEICFNRTFPDEMNEEIWMQILSCSTSTTNNNNLEEILQMITEYRPSVKYQQPYVLVNEHYSSKASIDVHRVICEQTTTENDCQPFKNNLRLEVYFKIDDIVSGRKFFTNSITPRNIEFIKSMLPSGKITFQPYIDDWKECFISQKEDGEESFKCLLLRTLYCFSVDLSDNAFFDFLHCFYTRHTKLNDADRIKQCHQEMVALDLIKEENDSCNLIAYVQQMQPTLNVIKPKNNETFFLLVNGQHDYRLLESKSIVDELCRRYFPYDNLVPGCQVCFKKTDANQCLIMKPLVEIHYATKEGNLASFLEQMLPYGDLFSPYDSIVELDIIPYGKTIYDEQSKVYLCPQGEKQCRSNWFHACVFQKYYLGDSLDLAKSNAVLEFIHCASNVMNTDDGCFNNYFPPSDYHDILSCAKNDDKLKDKLRIKAARRKSVSTQALVIDGKEVKEIGDSNAILSACERYPNLKPKDCQHLMLKSYGLSDVKLLISGGESTRKLIIGQLKPLIESKVQSSLNEMVNWNFIVWGPTIRDNRTLICATEKECDIVKLLACSVKQVENLETSNEVQTIGRRTAELLICFFGDDNWNADPNRVINGCFNRLFSSYYYLEAFRCTIDETNRLWPTLLEAEERTNNIVSDYKTINYPAVIINGNNGLLESNENGRNLVRVLCQYYKGPIQMKECESSSNSNSNSGNSLDKTILLTLSSKVNVVFLMTLIVSWLLFN